MTEREQAQELMGRLAAIGRGQLSLTARDAWVILAALHLAWRHQHLSAPLRETFWCIGHRLQRIFEEDQLVADLAAMGWVASLDVPVTERKSHEE